MWSAMSTVLITIGYGSLSVTKSTTVGCFGSLTNGSEPASWKRSGHAQRRRGAARWSRLTRVGKRVFALRLGPVVERRFKKNCRRWTELTRCADDLVATFRDREDAERFRQEVEERLAAFELHVAPEKTAVLRFDGSLLHRTGQAAMKPATFTFPGFKHFLTKTRRGTINIGRTASIKARERFLRRQADW
jgi:hypothetical protein